MSSFQRKKLDNPFPATVRRLAVVALGSAPEKKSLDSFRALMDSHGIEIVLQPGLFKRGLDSVLPGAEGPRAEFLTECWIDRSIDLIVSARGGYGSASLCDHVPWKKLPKRPVPVVGYSDVTAFHLAMLRHGKGIPIAGPMAQDIPAVCSSRQSSSSLHETLDYVLASGKRGHMAPDDYPHGFPGAGDSDAMATLVPGDAEGWLLPANLTVFASLIGTNLMPELQDAIPVLEDVNEPAYKIARCLNQIKQAGMLAKFAALAFASFRNCGTPSLLRQVFADFAESFHGPVVSGILFGHIRNSISLHAGRKVRLHAD